MNKNKISQPKYSNNIFLSINFTKKKEADKSTSKKIFSLIQRASKNQPVALKGS